MSTYNKTVWQDGDIITADKMNNIENGIYSYNEDITNIGSPRRQSKRKKIQQICILLTAMVMFSLNL